MLVVFSGVSAFLLAVVIYRSLSSFHWFGTLFFFSFSTFLFQRQLSSWLRVMALIFLHPGFDPVLLLHLAVLFKEHICFLVL